MKLLKLLTFITIFVLIPTFAILISLSRQFVIFEYTRSGFPSDPLGVDADVRFNVASDSVAFLTSWQRPHKSVQIIQQVAFPKTNKPAYNHKEISHLLDVKRYTDRIRLLFILSITSTVIIFSNNYKDKKKIQSILKASKTAAISLITVITLFGVAITFFWRWFFLSFHQLLFPQGNWTFSQQSTLIRLFPEIFWIDYAVLVISVILIISLIIILACTYLLRLNISSNSNK